VSFNELAIHSGGVVEGLLIPALADGNALVRENRLSRGGIGSAWLSWLAPPAAAPGAFGAGSAR
jgi:hypothetical protein